jgi:membrane-associated protein
MPYRRFLIADALGAVLWTVGFVLLGYGLGASWRVAERWIGRSSMLLAGIIAIAGLVLWLRLRRKQASAR